MFTSISFPSSYLLCFPFIPFFSFCLFHIFCFFLFSFLFSFSSSLLFTFSSFPLSILLFIFFISIYPLQPLIPYLFFMFLSHPHLFSLSLFSYPFLLSSLFCFLFLSFNSALLPHIHIYFPQTWSFGLCKIITQSWCSTSSNERPRHASGHCS